MSSRKPNLSDRRSLASIPHLLLKTPVLDKSDSRNNRLQDAEHVCWSAVATDPKNLSARESLVELILKQGDQARAEQVLRQASKDLADNPRGVRLLADYYAGTGQIDKARAEFASLAKKYPKNVSVQEGYVRVLLQVKDFAAAQAVITELMKKNSKDPQVAVLNGIVLFNNGKTTDAVNALQGAANDAPKDAFIQFWLGKAALANGDSSMAEKSFRQAAQLNPRDVDAQEELARMAIQRGDMNMLSCGGEDHRRRPSLPQWLPVASNCGGLP
ncbi:MAG: tetratricopeptide repeat protein [Terracidiphilus sp.]